MANANGKPRQADQRDNGNHEFCVKGNTKKSNETKKSDPAAHRDQ